MARFRKRLPQYDPSTDATLAIWLDATDTATSSLTNTSDASPSNGDTIKAWKSKKGTARSFLQSASETRPTFDSTGINGRGALRFNSSVLTANVLTGFQSMSGLTVLASLKRNTDTGFNNCAFGLTIGTGTSLTLLECTNTTRAGGRRLVGDSFQAQTGKSLADGETFVEAMAIDWANALISLYANGHNEVTNAAFQTTGTTAASDPFSISVGARVESVLTKNIAIDGWIQELLVWTSFKDQFALAGPHSYLCVRAGV